MILTEAPFQYYTDTGGDPLDEGYIYFGLPNQNPETAPIAIYWDQAGTIPAAQPIRTINGYPVRAGTPANVYALGNYSVTVKDKKRRLVYTAADSLTWQTGPLTLSQFGAVNGGVYTTNTPLKRAIIYANQKNVPLEIDVNVSIGESIPVSGGKVVLTGNGTITQTTAAVLLVMDDVAYFSAGPGITFNSSLTGLAAPPIGIRGKSVQYVDLQSTIGNVLVVMRGDGTSASRGKQANVRAKFTGDYTGAGTGDIANVLDVRQYETLDFSGSHFNVLGPERMIKTADMGTTRASGFTMLGTCQKQVIDCYNDTRNIYVDQYKVDVADCGLWLDQKQANLATSYPQSIYIGSGNVTITSSQTTVNVVQIQGDWGLPDEPAGYECKVEIEGLRAIVNAPNSFAPLISVRGVTKYSDSNCLVQRAAVFVGTPAPAFFIRNSRSISSDNADCLGHYEVGDGASTTDGVAYAKNSEIIQLSEPNIRDYNATGGLIFSLLGGAKKLGVDGGFITCPVGRALATRSIFIRNSTITEVDVTGVSAENASGTIGYDDFTANTITRRLVRGNGWQFGKFAWTPGSIAAGGSAQSPNVFPTTASQSDPVLISEPDDMLGLTKTCFLTSGGAARAVLRNPTAGSITGPAGTWFWETWKQ